MDTELVGLYWQVVAEADATDIGDGRTRWRGSRTGAGAARSSEGGLQHGVQAATLVSPQAPPDQRADPVQLVGGWLRPRGSGGHEVILAASATAGGEPLGVRR